MFIDHEIVFGCARCREAFWHSTTKSKTYFLSLRTSRTLSSQILDKTFVSRDLNLNRQGV